MGRTYQKWNAVRGVLQGCINCGKALRKYNRSKKKPGWCVECECHEWLNVSREMFDKFFPDREDR